MEQDNSLKPVTLLEAYQNLDTIISTRQYQGGQTLFLISPRYRTLFHIEVFPPPPGQSFTLFSDTTVLARNSSDLLSLEQTMTTRITVEGDEHIVSVVSAPEDLPPDYSLLHNILIDRVRNTIINAGKMLS